MFKRIAAWLFFNRTPTQTIAKNALWLLAGQLVGRLLRAAIVIYAARLLGAASWGAFSYALSIAAFLTIFSDIGINALLTKEASRDPERRNQYAATALFTKIILLLPLAAGAVLLMPYLTNIKEAATLLPFAVLVFAFDTLRDLGAALSRALQKMQIEAGIGIFTNFAIVLLGFLFLTVRATSSSLAAAYALGSGLGFLLTGYILRDHFRNLRANFRPALIAPILKTAWPFGLLGLMGIINLNTDILMLGWMRSPEEVGYYAAAQKIILLLYILPTLLASSVFPQLARLAHTEPSAAKTLLEKSLALVIGAAIPIAALGIFFGGLIVPFLFGSEYLPAVTTFKILIATVLIVFPSSVLGNAIFAFDAQKSFALFVAVSALGNVFFNALFIPRWGIEGAAASTILTQLITNALIWRKMKSLSKFNVLSRLSNYFFPSRKPET